MAHQALNIGEYSVFLEETSSTNETLKTLYSAEPLPEGALVYAHYQTAGRGYLQNVWESEKGENLLASVLLKPQFLQAEEQIWLNVVVSLALRELAETYSKMPATIKWPNDIYIQQNKVAGILIENTLQGSKIKHSIIGMGLNINQQHFKNEKVASLFQFAGVRFEPKELRLALCAQLNHFYGLLRGKQFNLLWDLYHKHLMGKGQYAQFKKGSVIFEGLIMGIDKKGRLHLEVEEEVRCFVHKEIEFVQLINPSTNAHTGN